MAFSTERAGAAYSGRPALFTSVQAPALAALACGLLAGAPPPAIAAEWTISGAVSERFEVQTDRQLEGENAPVIGATTELTLEAERRAARSTLTLGTGLTGAVFGGPGDTEDLDRIDPPSANVTYRFDGARVDVDTGFDLAFQPTSFAQIEETGITTEDATQLTIRLDSSVAYAIDAANRLTAGSNLRLVRFTEGATELAETTSFGIDVGWSHNVNSRLAWNTGIGATWFNAETTRSIIFDATVGVSYRANSRLALNASFGGDATRTRESGAGSGASDTNFGLTAAAGLDWGLTPDTTLGLEFSQGLEPSALGELQTATRLSLGLAHRLNSWAGLTLDADYLRQVSGGGFEANGTRRQLLTLSSVIDLTLSRSWSAGLGYTSRFEREDGDAVSHLVFFQVTRELEILP